MNNLNYTVQSMKFSTYLSLEGDLRFKDAADFKQIISKHIVAKKDVYLDIKDINSIDIIGLNCLITAKIMVNNVDGQLFILVNNTNTIYELMDKIKLKKQLDFRSILIQDSYYNLAS